jgi:hypothetical protein
VRRARWWGWLVARSEGRTHLGNAAGRYDPRVGSDHILLGAGRLHLRRRVETGGGGSEPRAVVLLAPGLLPRGEGVVVVCPEARAP